MMTAVLRPGQGCQHSRCIILSLLVALLAGWGKGQPDFAAPLNNVSVPVGRDATFSCVVTMLGGYRMSPGMDNLQVGWVKADTKAIQAIHTHVITHNNRVSVSHSDRNTWMLHITGVQEEDRGPYMCQINTDPMRSQIGFLEVTVPPEIADEGTSSDEMAPEGSNIHLRCRAHGYPKPVITWSREDQKAIVLRTNDPANPKRKEMTYEGEFLNLTHITRSDMGPYLCMANNSVPPIVSKRIMVNVHFRPVIHVPNQLIGVPIGSETTLECNLEASPKSIQYWTRDSGEMLISNKEYITHEKHSNFYMTKMTLTITHFRSQHAGEYYCTAKNSLGEAQGRIKVYEMEQPTEPPSYYEEELDLHENEVGRSGYTPDIFTNEIPAYGRPRSWEGDTVPTKYNDVIARGGHGTYGGPNHRAPSQPSVEKKHPIGGDPKVGRPTRPPRWGWDQSGASWLRFANTSLVAILCLVCLALA
ncbi:lachesin-like isoform X2 [Penaeus monodon]|uniref:lachesin-like isoform X2 n=1 Tax=Penaeus monodon TaxID=6687 RepID=UPI0018A75F85|nr:lachesin-like isoform X2 [Penaeus monodon]